MADEELISIIDIAEIHGKRRQSLHKIVSRLGFNVVKKKSDKGRGQSINHITAADYEVLKKHLQRVVKSAAETAIVGSGAFYVIQLEPQLDPGRIKVGFTENLDERLRSHRTSAPFAEIVASWPCKSLWERTAIECVTQSSEQLYSEVFRTESIGNLIERGNCFFDLMPDASV